MFEIIAKIFCKHHLPKYKLVSKKDANYIVFEGYEPIKLTDAEYYDILSSKGYELGCCKHEFEEDNEKENN